ncbi:MAG: alkene reductase [Sphingopyxis sp.]|nr:alkene reductase [Sphingopyxis sp.]
MTSSPNDRPRGEAQTARGQSLFDPVRVGLHDLDHRIVMAPITRFRAEAAGVPGPPMAEYYRQRTTPGGLIVSEACAVSASASGDWGAPGLFNDEQMRGWAEVVSAVHARGGKIVAQLWHAGRMSHPDLQPDGAQPVAPSAFPASGTCRTPHGERPFPVPRAIHHEEIGFIVGEYRDAAVQALRAGFDGVEIHAANGGLPGQFLHAGSNRRGDEYGGDIACRARFLFRVLTAVMAVWGVKRVGVQLSPGGSSGSISDPDMPALYRYLLEALSGYDLAYLHLVVPRHDDADPALTLRALRALFRGTLIAAGEFDRPSASAAIAAGDADLIAFARHFLAKPDLPQETSS